jgi:hypothetical protein
MNSMDIRQRIDTLEGIKKNSPSVEVYSLRALSQDALLVSLSLLEIAYQLALANEGQRLNTE